MIFLRRLLLKLSYPLARVYWFVFRPKTFGVKAIINCEDYILLVRHSYNRGWTFPGGGINLGEKPQQAIARELKEELNIEVGEFNFLQSIDSDREYKRDKIYIFGLTIDSLTKNMIEIDQVEIVETRWVKEEEVKSLLNKFNQQIFNCYERV